MDHGRTYSPGFLRHLRSRQRSRTESPRTPHSQRTCTPLTWAACGVCATNTKRTDKEGW